MNRTLAMMVAVTMLAATVPMMSTQASESPEQVPQVMDTIVFQEREPGADHPGAEGQLFCTSEDASTVTSIDPSAPGLRENAYCTTGAHDPAFYSITHGPDLATMEASGFTGVVESIIQYETGERRWACSFTGGTWVTCEGDGSWPGEATEFCHDVWAYETQGAPSVPLITGFAPGCPNGQDALGLGLGANTQPAGDGVPEEAWAAYVIHG